MLPAKAIIILALVTATITSVFAIASSESIFPAMAQSEKPDKKTVGGHASTGFGIYETSGDVLDPLDYKGNLSSDKVIDPDAYLRSFNYGRVSKLDNGTTVREFTLIARDDLVKEVSPGVFYNVWAFNETVPGPTLRATEGDIIRILFINHGSKTHTIHTHGIHEAVMDGVFEHIGPGGSFVYEFKAEKYGVYPYHCHMMPLEEHIGHGLYGVYIVDPKTPRPDADEMVMIMNGFDTDFDTENNFYAVNSIPFYYLNHPIEIEKDRLIRIYLVNMLEFDPINNFHLHGNLYNVYRSGTSTVPDELTDMVTMSQGERGILEFTYKYPGDYMFHAHKTEFAEKGWMDVFRVVDSTPESQSDSR